MTPPRSTRSVFALVALLASGCVSMFAVEPYYARSDRYAVPSTERDRYAPSYTGRDRYALSFNERSKFELRPVDPPAFASFGPPYVPLVPVVIKLSSSDDLELTFAVRTFPERDFSVARRPCLSSEDGAKLCAARAEIRWEAPGVFAKEPRSLIDDAMSEAPVPARLTRDALYARVGYTGDPSVEWLELSGKYLFHCPGSCAKSYALDIDSLFDSEGVSLTPGPVAFRRELDFRYEPFRMFIWTRG